MLILYAELHGSVLGRVRYFLDERPEPQSHDFKVCLQPLVRAQGWAGWSLTLTVKVSLFSAPTPGNQSLMGQQTVSTRHHVQVLPPSVFGEKSDHGEETCLTHAAWYIKNTMKLRPIFTLFSMRYVSQNFNWNFC